ncbi:hypothetical protein F0562_010231 [Nyssa sinensis]|uniref:Bulb-type lectin domain-containing protein n=1 Tax=Nyssa sinensis TaxID=561372 RepID=A0A5J5A1F4_9ASTE|nr:hypothetical protein F0562_010231 [Nyssa sinensis]
MESQPFFTFFYALIYFSTLLKFSTAADTIARNESIRDGETLVSFNRRFEIGFFSPGSSRNRYLGVWYKSTPSANVWVANRNNPILDSNGVLTISKNGTLVLLNGTNGVIWSTNISKVAESPVAQLLDSGNLVLLDKTSTSSNTYLWQSFDFPCDTRLQGMKMGKNSDTGLDQYLTSWKSADDPSSGDFTYRVENHGLPQLVVSMGSVRKYRSGPWNGLRFSGFPLLTNPAVKPKFDLEGNNLNYILNPYNNSVITRQTLNHTGLLQLYVMNENNTEWDLIPKSPEEWEVLDSSSGCLRSVPLDCQSGEGFVKVAGVKLPDLLEFWLNTSMSLNECEAECLKNCSCMAYTNSNISGGGSGCLIWFGDLIDVREFIAEDSEQDIYIRLPASELRSINDSHKKQRRVKILVVSSISGMLILGLVCRVYNCKDKGKKER